MPFVKMSEIPQRELVPGFKGRFIHADALTIAHWEIEAGSELPDHAHQQEMIINM
jgi:quercetin dioxygenase-like cupin family protein